MAGVRGGRCRQVSAWALPRCQAAGDVQRCLGEAHECAEGCCDLSLANEGLSRLKWGINLGFPSSFAATRTQCEFPHSCCLGTRKDSQTEPLNVALTSPPHPLAFATAVGLQPAAAPGPAGGTHRRGSCRRRSPSAAPAAGGGEGGGSGQGGAEGAGGWGASRLSPRSVPVLSSLPHAVTAVSRELQNGASPGAGECVEARGK